MVARARMVACDGEVAYKREDQAVSKRGRQGVRKPATKFPHLKKKLERAKFDLAVRRQQAVAKVRASTGAAGRDTPHR